MWIEVHQYNNFTMLKKRILDIPIQEINNKTDIFISYQLERSGRLTTAILFTMNGKKESQQGSSDYKTISERLSYYGVKQNKIDELIAKHDEQYLLANLEIVEEQISKWEIKNTTGYLLKAFQTDFRATETEHIKNKKSEARAKAESKLKQEQEQNEQESLKQAQTEQRKKLIESFIVSLPPDEFQKLKNDFIQENQNNAMFQKFFANGEFVNVFIKGMRFNYLEKLIA